MFFLNFELIEAFSFFWKVILFKNPELEFIFTSQIRYKFSNSIFRYISYINPSFLYVGPLIFWFRCYNVCKPCNFLDLKLSYAGEGWRYKDGEQPRRCRENSRNYYPLSSLLEYEYAKKLQYSEVFYSGWLFAMERRNCFARFDNEEGYGISKSKRWHARIRSRKRIRQKGKRWSLETASGNEYEEKIFDQRYAYQVQSWTKQKVCNLAYNKILRNDIRLMKVTRKLSLFYYVDILGLIRFRLNI